MSVAAITLPDQRNQTRCSTRVSHAMSRTSHNCNHPPPSTRPSKIGPRSVFHQETRYLFYSAGVCSLTLEVETFATAFESQMLVHDPTVPPGLL